MGEPGLTYDELKARYDELQRRSTRSIVISQDLINAKDRLDRDLACFVTIQKFGERAINARSFEAFAQIAVESIIEGFEFECSALLTCDSAGNNVRVEAAFGFETLKAGDALDMDWMKARATGRGEGASVETVENAHPWRSLGLCQVILCGYEDRKGALQGFLLGGRSERNQGYYDEITRETIPSFTVFTQQMRILLQNLRSREDLERTVQERTEALKSANVELQKTNADLEQEITIRTETEEKLRLAEREATGLSEFLKKMFGRYLSAEVMNSLLENPSALELGGERREVTIMMSDLRGFTALSERLEPEQVVQLLNTYFEAMVGVIHQYNGTVNEIIGDSLLVIFGAPQEMTDRAQRAVACAIAMQNAMAEVNKTNQAAGLPELEMGIGLHDTEVVVGNIGSSKRIKYSVVGSGVNLASRIESYTVGGQVLISDSVRQQAGEILRIDDEKRVTPKGATTDVVLYDIGGIGGSYNLALAEEDPGMVGLSRQVPVECTLIGGKHVTQDRIGGRIVRLSKRGCEVDLNETVPPLTNIRMNLGDVDRELGSKDFYGKVIEQPAEGGSTHIVRFTAVPPEVRAYFQSHRQHGTASPSRAGAGVSRAAGTRH